MNITSEYIEVHIFRKTKSQIEYLILKRSETESYPGLWQPVTGTINKNEKAYETAVREIYEETGLLPEKFWLVPKVSSFYIPTKDVISLYPVFCAEILTEAEVKLSPEHSEYKWVGYNDAYKTVAWKQQRESLELINEHFGIGSMLNFIEIKIDRSL